MKSTIMGIQASTVRLLMCFAALLAIGDVASGKPRSSSVVRDTVGGSVVLDWARLGIRNPVICGLRIGRDVLVLMEGEVARFTPRGMRRWSFPSIINGGGRGGLVKIPGGDVIEFEYNGIADSGVGVQRFSPIDGARRWSVHCEGLGVDHSKYFHRATVTIEGNELKVASRASGGTFVEWVDLGTGKRVRRITE